VQVEQAFRPAFIAPPSIALALTEKLNRKGMLMYLRSWHWTFGPCA
jgi:hypothetical protein